jgi:hypothetical protein
MSSDSFPMPSRPVRNLHGSVMDLHTALRRDEAIAKALKFDASR